MRALRPKPTLVGLSPSEVTVARSPAKPEIQCDDPRPARPHIRDKGSTVNLVNVFETVGELKQTWKTAYFRLTRSAAGAVSTR